MGWVPPLLPLGLLRCLLAGLTSHLLGDYMCPNQITNCAALCKDGVSVNTCHSNNGGQDNPFEDITYCFECSCADGSTPDLASYYDTIPSDVCERSRESCQYGYDMYGELAPDGACPTCASQYAVEPTWYVAPTLLSTTSLAAAATTSSAEVEITATTSSSSEDIGVSTTSSPTSMSTSVLETGSTSSSTGSTSSSSFSEVSSSPTTTVQLPTTVFTSTTTSATTRPRTSSTTSVAPVKSAQAAMVEPVMGVFGIGLAAIMVL